MTNYFDERQKLSHRLQGIINTCGDDIAETLENALATVAGKIAVLESQADKTTGLIKRQKLMQKRQADIQAALAGVYEDIGQRIKTTALDAAEGWPELIAGITDKSLPEGVSAGLTWKTVTQKQLAAYWEVWQVDGLFFPDWIQKLQDGAAQRIIKASQERLIAGQAAPELYKTLAKALDTGRHSAQALAETATRTMTQHAEYLSLLESGDRLKGVRFVAELDRKTTPLCRSLDGKEYKLNDAPRPPLHMRCRSWLWPVWNDVMVNGKRVPWEDAVGDAYEQAARRITRMDTEPRKVHHRDGTTSTAYRGYDTRKVPRDMTYNQWMTSMVNSSNPKDVAFAREALGPTRFNLVSQGKLRMESLYYQGRLRTIKELKELL